MSTPRKPPSTPVAPRHPFGQGGLVVRAALYGRVSTRDQTTIPAQLDALREYARLRGWTVAIEASDVASGATDRPGRKLVLDAARRREIDVVLVARLDRWGRSLHDLVGTLAELAEVGVGFVSLAEALDQTTAAGRAMLAMIATFAQFERELLAERVREGMDRARAAGKQIGRPARHAHHREEVRRMKGEVGPDGLATSTRLIAARLGISRATVRRLLAETGE